MKNKDLYFYGVVQLWFIFFSIDERRASALSSFQYPWLEDSTLRMTQLLAWRLLSRCVYIFSILCRVTLDREKRWFKRSLLTRYSLRTRVNRDLNRKVFSPCLHMLYEKDGVCNDHQVSLCMDCCGFVLYFWKKY